MEYLDLFQEWFGQTGIYREFLKNMPPPVNNIYFDMACVMVLAGYLLFRVADGMRIRGYHRRIRRRQAEEQGKQCEAERQLKERETEVRGREERIYHFLDACEYYFRNRGGRNAEDAGGQARISFFRIGRRGYLLSDDRGEADASQNPMEIVSDYEVRMREMEECRKQEETFEEYRRKERERLNDSMDILEQQMRMEPESPVGGGTDAGADFRFEKRRARALKEEQREKERARRAAERKGKKEKRGLGGEN